MGGEGGSCILKYQTITGNIQEDLHLLVSDITRDNLVGRDLIGDSDRI